MSQQNTIQQLIQNRIDFSHHLKRDVQKNAEQIKQITSKIQSLRETIETIGALSGKIEHESLIPLGKRIFVNAKLVHTNEYFIDHIAHPNSYSTNDTAAHTIEMLEKRIEIEEKSLENAKLAEQQLCERLNLIELDKNESEQLSAEQIVSDRGVAVKMGEFYEIIEFEDD